jgi:hypothetical protein
MPAKRWIASRQRRLSPRMVNNLSPKSATGTGFVNRASAPQPNASNFIESANGIGTGDRLGFSRDRERDTMITRLLVALFALYIVAGSPNPRDLPLVSALQSTNVATTGQTDLTKQALDFCLSNREACASMASGLIGAPVRTGAISAKPIAPETQALPQPAPELPLPPRRRASSDRGA